MLNNVFNDQYEIYTYYAHILSPHTYALVQYDEMRSPL